MRSRLKGMTRALVLALAGALVGSVAGCGGGDDGNVRPTPPTSTFSGSAFSLVNGAACAGVGVITTRHSTYQSAETAARQRCQSEAANLATQVGGLAHICRSVWTNECGAIYGGRNSQRCVVSGAHGSSASAARSNALQDCQNTLGSGAQCDVIAAGCASGGAPPVGVWRPSGGPTQPPSNTQNLRNVSVTIPSSCPREVEVCVRDHQCEDGDQVRVSVNNSVIFSGEIFNRWACRRVPVQTGSNSIQLFAINGTGFKGNCDHTDANTGEMRVRGGSNGDTQSWQHSGGTGSNARINVNIGPAGGSCTPGTTPVQSNLYGAVASSIEDNCRSRYTAIAANHSSEASARSAALSGCRNRGGSQCSVDTTFGSAYAGNNQCGALAYGKTSTQCRLRAGTGSTESAAESDALARCRSGGFSCSLVQGTRGRFASCAQ